MTAVPGSTRLSAFAEMAVCGDGGVVVQDVQIVHLIDLRASLMPW